MKNIIGPPVYGEDLKAAMMLLDNIAQNDFVTLGELQEATGQLFNYEILISLVDYEYLTLSGEQQYNFTLNIIKNWWKQKRNI